MASLFTSTMSVTGFALLFLLFAPVPLAARRIIQPYTNSDPNATSIAQLEVDGFASMDVCDSSEEQRAINEGRERYFKERLGIDGLAGWEKSRSWMDKSALQHQGEAESLWKASPDCSRKHNIALAMHLHSHPNDLTIKYDSTRSAISDLVMSDVLHKTIGPEWEKHRRLEVTLPPESVWDTGGFREHEDVVQYNHKGVFLDFEAVAVVKEFIEEKKSWTGKKTPSRVYVASRTLINENGGSLYEPLPAWASEAGISPKSKAPTEVPLKCYVTNGEQVDQRADHPVVESRIVRCKGDFIYEDVTCEKQKHPERCQKRDNRHLELTIRERRTMSDGAQFKITIGQHGPPMIVVEETVTKGFLTRGADYTLVSTTQR